MTMTIEKSLKDFNFWGGAAANAAKLTADELDALEQQLEELQTDDGLWSTTEINDLMWFDFEQVCEMIGLDYDEVMEGES